MFGINREWEPWRAASFGLEFVRSEAFSALFEEGMELVEEAVGYLDGPGRNECTALTPEQTTSYAEESVQLTRRLVQITGWLLAQRALAEGRASVEDAAAGRTHLLPLKTVETPDALFDSLPAAFRALSGLTARLYTRIQHLQDLLLEADGFMPDVAVTNPVAEQRGLLEKAFAHRH